MTATVLTALMPVVLLILLGAVLQRWQFLDEGFWLQCERLVYFILLPSLLFHGLATAQLEALPVRGMAWTLALSTLALAALVLLLRPFMGLDGPAFTSVFQGSVRFNNYVGMTIAGGLFGAQGLALAALCNAVIVPLVMVLSVLAFARHGALRFSGRDLFHRIFLNPLLVASLVGLAFQYTGWRLPTELEPTIKALASASLALGLLCIGAALKFKTMGQWMGPIATSSALKFLVLPLLTLLIARSLDLSGPALTVVLLFQALPTASSAYIMARQLGGDAPMMAGITAAQTVLAAPTLPLVLIGFTAWLPT